MTGNTTTINQDKEETVDRQEMASVSAVIQAMVKAAKAFRIYLANNPLHQKFLDQLRESMESHLEDYGDIKFDIEQFHIRYKGTSVYQNPDAKDSLAFRLNSDGIGALIFNEGIEVDEIHDFLDIVGQERPYETDDDIVTQLWSRNLPHIQYILTEEATEASDAAVSTGRGTPETQKEGIQGLYKGMPPYPPIPTPMAIPQSILSLSEDELVWLKRAREAEEKRQPVSDVIEIITAILISTPDADIFSEFLDVTFNLVRDLIMAGEMTHSFQLLDFIIRLEEKGKLPPSHRMKLSESKKSLFSDEMITGIAKIIDEPGKIDPSQIKKMLLSFGRDAIGALCHLLGIVNRKDMRKVIIESLVVAGRDHPADFAPFLRDERWYLVRNTVLILRLIGAPEGARSVAHLSQHNDPRVRKEVFLYLMEIIADDAAKEQMLAFLRDKNGSLRLRAVKALGQSGYRNALKPIMGAVSTPDFEELGLPERKIYFEAIGDLGGDDSLPLFRELLEKRFWLNKAKEKDAVSCAVAGLRKIRSAAALNLLNEARGSKKGEALEILDQAIRALTGK